MSKSGTSSHTQTLPRVLAQHVNKLQTDRVAERLGDLSNPDLSMDSSRPSALSRSCRLTESRLRGASIAEGLDGGGAGATTRL